MRPMLLAALALPLALTACDDGSERISELEGNLQSEQSRIAALEGELRAEKTRAENFERQVAEIETLRTSNAELTTRAETAEARVTELEAAPAAAPATAPTEAPGAATPAAEPAFDAARLGGPLNALVTNLREMDDGLTTIRRAARGNSEVIEALDGLRGNMREAGRQIEAISSDAKVELQ